MAARNSGELISDLRKGNCVLSKNPDFQSRRDRNDDTISEEYVVEYANGEQLVIHIHNKIGDQSHKVHVKNSSFGNILFGLGNSWAKFIKLTGLTVAFG